MTQSRALAPETALVRPDFSAVLSQHRAVEDARGEIKSCRCGLLFGVQHQENGSHGPHVAAVLNAEVDRWLTDEGTRERAARAMSGPHWWAEDDNGVGDEIRQSIREDAASALGALVSERSA